MDNKDYRYYMQDISNVFIGGKCTYEELMDDDDVSFKLRTIFAHFMLKEVDPSTTIENHIFFIEKGSLSYMIYKKLKAKFRLNVFSADGHGKGKPGYHIEEYTIDDIVSNAEIQAKKDQIFLNEVRIKKLSIMGIVT